MWLFQVQPLLRQEINWAALFPSNLNPGVHSLEGVAKAIQAQLRAGVSADELSRQIKQQLLGSSGRVEAGLPNLQVKVANLLIERVKAEPNRSPSLYSLVITQTGGFSVQASTEPKAILQARPKPSILSSTPVRNPKPVSNAQSNVKKSNTPRQSTSVTKKKITPSEAQDMVDDMMRRLTDFLAWQQGEAKKTNRGRRIIFVPPK